MGAIFGVTDAIGGEILETSRDNFRQRLARARREFHQFMHGQCGLVDEANPCRCAKKTWAFMKAFRRIDGRWKVVHSQWSYAKPALTARP